MCSLSVKYNIAIYVNRNGTKTLFTKTNNEQAAIEEVARLHAIMDSLGQKPPEFQAWYERLDLEAGH